MGKDYARKKANRKGDLYDTPYSALWVLLEKEKFSNCLEPCSGNNALINAAPKGFYTDYFDLHKNGKDFFDLKKWDGDIVTNPPFSEWDRFVTHAKNICSGKIAMIGKTNFFGCVGRSNSGIWDNLEKVYIFNRYIDYQPPAREDGLCYVGVLCTGWFVFGKEKCDTKFYTLDISKYATLGNWQKPVKREKTNNKPLTVDQLHKWTSRLIKESKGEWEIVRGKKGTGLDNHEYLSIAELGLLVPAKSRLRVEKS